MKIKQALSVCIFIALINSILFSQVNVSESSPKLVYSTFLGGSRDDGSNNWLTSFTIDESGTIYFATSTESADFPFTEDAYDKTYNGGHAEWGLEDIMVIQFNIKQGNLKYASYFGGGTGPEFVTQLLFKKNSMYLVGNTGSSDFPVSDNAYDPAFNGPVFRHSDGYLSQFDSNKLAYSTFIGTGGIETMTDILVNDDGEMTVIGQLKEWREKEITNQFSSEISDDLANLFIAGFNSKGDSILSSTLLGPVSGIDAAKDSEGCIYIAGTTSSKYFPITSEAYDTSYNGGKNYWEGDIFITKLSPAGDQIFFSTYLGGTGDESIPNICLDRSNNIIVFGRTNSTDFPITDDAIDKSFDGISDLFIAKLSKDGRQLLYSSFLGGNQKTSEYIGNIIPSKNDDIYLCGYTDAEDHPVTPNAINSKNSGGKDLFITVFDNSLMTIKYSTYLGGKSDENNPVINLDSEDNIIGICATNSPDFPTTSGAFDTSSNGGYDIAMFMLSSLDNSQTDVGNRNRIPHDFQLNQNYPNPFNPITVISYKLSVISDVSFKIYDVLGREITTLVNGMQSPGMHTIEWNAQSYPSGVYFYKLHAGIFAETKKMTLLK